MHGQTQHHSFILASDQGSSGWNEGTAWLLAISNSMYAFGGTDGGSLPLSQLLGPCLQLTILVIHISEEIPRPGRRVPQVMLMTMVIGIITCLSLFIVFMFFLDDMDAIQGSPLPSLELVYQMSVSRSVVTGLASNSERTEQEIGVLPWHYLLSFSLSIRVTRPFLFILVN